MSMEIIMKSIHRLARSYGYDLPCMTGSVTRAPGKDKAYVVRNLKCRKDGSAGPVVIVRIVEGRMVWERRA